MLSGYKVISLSHKELSLDTLSKVQLPYEDDNSLYNHLRQIVGGLGIDEIMLVSTCNRMELFYYSEALDDHRQLLKAIFEDGYEAAPDIFSSAIYYENRTAVEHIIRVAASLESLVVGERQILGQLRDAYDKAKSYGLSGDNLRILMKAVVQASKEIFTRTTIGEKPVSVVSLAFSKLKSTGISNGRIAMLGAGKTQQLMAKFLRKYSDVPIDVYNRTEAKAIELAETFAQGKGYALDALVENDIAYDTWITCTGSPTPILKAEMIEAHGGKGKRVVIVDLALPADTDPEVLNSLDIEYIHLTDLEKIAEKNMNSRKSALIDADKIVAEQVKQFYNIFQQRQIEKAFRSLPQDLHEIRDRAITQVFKKDLDKMDEDSRQVVMKIADYITKKSINIPIKTAKAIVAN